LNDCSTVDIIIVEYMLNCQGEIPINIKKYNKFRLKNKPNEGTIYPSFGLFL
jgi:hypothetical protein